MRITSVSILKTCFSFNLHSVIHISVRVYVYVIGRDYHSTMVISLVLPL